MECKPYTKYVLIHTAGVSGNNEKRGDWQTQEVSNTQEVIGTKSKWGSTCTTTPKFTQLGCSHKNLLNFIFGNYISSVHFGKVQRKLSITTSDHRAQHDLLFFSFIIIWEACACHGTSCPFLLKCAVSFPSWTARVDSQNFLPVWTAQSPLSWASWLASAFLLAPHSCTETSPPAHDH